MRGGARGPGGPGATSSRPRHQRLCANWRPAQPG